MRILCNTSTVLTAALFTAAELICSTALASPQVSFKPAEVASAADTRYPVESIADGVVVLNVALTERGKVSGIDAVRDVPSLTSAATSSVASWKFKPASQDGLLQASAMTVAFVFRPPVSLWKPPSFASAISNPKSITPAYTPAGIVSVGYAEYPVNSVAAGAVVVQVTVDDHGKIERMKVIRSMRGFTQFALRAAKQWRFQPATLEGKPVVSNVAIAFVFAPPNPISP
ncbi:MAG: TonB family protein [Candidatus Acidiferrales bacterium]